MLSLAAPRPIVAGTPARYSVVRGFDPRGSGCSLTIESPTRQRTRLHIACPPDTEAAEDLRSAGLRPLALRLDLDTSGVPHCSGLFASSEGPQRRSIPLGAALSLCAEGLHTVVTRGC